MFFYYLRERNIYNGLYKLEYFFFFNISFKKLTFNPVDYKKKPYIKISFDKFFFALNVLYERNRKTSKMKQA